MIAPVEVVRDDMLPLTSAVADTETPGPVSVQLCTLAADQLKVDALPGCTREGDAVSTRFEFDTVAVTLACEPPGLHCTV